MDSDLEQHFTWNWNWILPTFSAVLKPEPDPSSDQSGFHTLNDIMKNTYFFIYHKPKKR